MAVNRRERTATVNALQLGMRTDSEPVALRLMRPLPITTASLTLRRLAPDDAPSLLRLNAEQSTRCWLPSQVYADLAQARASIDALIGCYAAPGDARRGPYVLGIDLRGNGQLLGHVGFSPLGDAVEVSYAMAEDARGRGYATEALAEACCWAADAFALPGLIAVTAKANEASRRLLERVGFRHLCDEVMRFQGTGRLVGRYLWTPVSPPACGA
jgi:RimJ/RimL family protein N-acetyltransferase